jgi:hypothetical protein
MILSKAELADLTGKVRLSAQARVLAALGIPYRRRPDGTIVVFRDSLSHAPEKERPPPPRLRLPEARRVLAR